MFRCTLCGRFTSQGYTDIHYESDGDYGGGWEGEVYCEKCALEMDTSKIRTLKEFLENPYQT